MNFDYFTSAALVDELNTIIGGGRIQDVLQLDALSLGLELYAHQQRHYLYLSADPEHPRLHLNDGKLRKGVAQPAPLTQWLTSYVEGGKLLRVHQPPWERILIFDILSGEHQFSLVFEPIERRANLILIEDGIIKECIRRVGADENRVRQLLPGQVYHAPPAQAKTEPQAVTLETFQTLFDSASEAKVSSLLPKAIHGISPLLAREVAFMAGDLNLLAADASPRHCLSVFEAVITPLLARQWQPGTLHEGEMVIGFSVYPIRQRPGWQPAESVSAALVAFYGAVTGEQAYAAAKKPILAQLKAAEKKLAGKLFSLKSQQRDDADLQAHQTNGQLLLTYQHLIAKNQSEFSPPRYEGDDSPPLVIKLDPLLSPVENAQRYFEKYEKAKRSRQSLPDLILETERELRYLAQLETDLDLASDWNDIGEVQDALLAAGYWRGEKRRQTNASGRSGPLRVESPDGVLIWVGRNSRQNEEVTFSKGTNGDLWLHVRGMPGAHVVVKTYGRSVSQATLEQAASLAAYYSKGRREKAVDVMVTDRKHVRKIKGAKTGMVRVAEQSHPSILAVPRSEDSF
jgi:predicted ribosome quality control (RQC) complex YloA/Tae2 family protein